MAVRRTNNDRRRSDSFWSFDEGRARWSLAVKSDQDRYLGALRIRMEIKDPETGEIRFLASIETVS